MMRLTVDVQSGPHAGERFHCAAGQTLRIGRHKPADIALSQDAMVSNTHCELICTETGCKVHDLTSRFGTTLNGKPVKEKPADAANGDKVQVGNTVLLLRLRAAEQAEQTIVPQHINLPEHVKRAFDAIAAPPKVPSLIPADSPPAWAQETMRPAAPRTDPVIELPPVPPPAPPAPETPADLVVKFLRIQPQPLYALLDAARSPRVLELLRESKEEYKSLYEGAKGEEIAPWGPWLVRLPAESPLLEALVKEGWGDSWGVYLTAQEDFAAVRKHFRHFLLAKLPDGREVYFRFYDPRVLRVFLPTCTVEETGKLFGPVAQYFTEAVSPEAMWRFRSSVYGLKGDELRVALA